MVESGRDEARMDPYYQPVAQDPPMLANLNEKFDFQVVPSLEEKIGKLIRNYYIEARPDNQGIKTV